MNSLDIKAITAKPTADNPQYKNKEAWPMLVGDEYFQKQKWPKARLLIWAQPGKNGNPLDPANWINAATGKPAEKIYDMNTDLILPDSEKGYTLKGKGGACRHLTVGKKAQFFPAGGGSLSVFGNLWVRPGSTLHIYRTLKLVGDGDTFVRSDWPPTQPRAIRLDGAFLPSTLAGMIAGNAAAAPRPSPACLTNSLLL